MKKTQRMILSVALAGMLSASVAMGMAGCNAALSSSQMQVQEVTWNAPTEAVAGNAVAGAVNIQLSDDGITVDGKAALSDLELAKMKQEDRPAVYTAHDIIYYQSGQDFKYGEGTESDSHSAEEADSHTVVHISQPGTYALSGKLSAGQVLVDLGDDAQKDSKAKVTLILNGVDITNTVAPGVMFYNVYECGQSDEAKASKDVDTSKAGANVVIADGTTNIVNGSYVAKIYKSVELNEAGTEVTDSKKLHKYDGAFYSKQTMNVNGGEVGDGQLVINAQNEGLDSELHLTINGGNIWIDAGNDGINTNEDNVSVTAIHGGNVNIRVSGSTGEGDGIDSNGWLVIDGGTVTTAACGSSGDAGVDSDKGIYVNGGTVTATGNMYDQVQGEQNTLVFSFQERQKAGTLLTVKDESGKEVATLQPQNDFQYAVISSADLAEGTYTVWSGSSQLSVVQGGEFGGPGGPGGQPPADGQGGPNGERPDGQAPDAAKNGKDVKSDGNRPEPPDGANKGEHSGKGDRPDGANGPGGQGGPHGQRNVDTSNASKTFEVKSGVNFFVIV